MEEGRELISHRKFDIVTRRLCHELVENYQDFSDACIVGLQPRGTILSDMISHILQTEMGISNIEYGILDITFYRDDFRRRSSPLKASTTEIDFLVEGRHVLLIDDVLYTGRTVHAAIAAIQDFGRPEQIEMLCLIDRRFNRHFPIKADYKGLAVDALDEAYVRVRWKDQHGEDQVILYAGKIDS